MRGATQISTALPENPQCGSAQATVNFPEVNLGLLPGRGFLYSLVFYAAIVLAIIYQPFGRALSHPQPAPHWTVTMLPKDVIYLPALGGGSAGAAAKGGSAPSHQTSRQTSIAAQSKPGVSYPGPQPIVSNPPNPTNRVQTILQPELQNPILLKKFVPLPNMVKLAAPAPPVETQEAESPEGLVAPKIASEPIPMQPIALATPILKPKLPLPVRTSSSTIPMQTAPKPASPPKLAAQAKPLSPKAPPVTNGIDPRSLLVLSPIPSLSPPAKMPAGEARGQFAITAQPNLAMLHLGPGSATAAAASAVVGVGTHPDASAHDATGSNTARPGANANAAPGGGLAEGASTPGAGGATRGSSAGNGAGAAGGRGTGEGSGSGAGAGAGGGAFPGISIEGGEVPSDEDMTPRNQNNGSRTNGQNRQGSYGLEIVSTGNSGGGMGDFGVFHNQTVFTVYINMTSVTGNFEPSWMLEYAQARTADDPQGNLVAPFPLKKVTPSWPADRIARYSGQLMVVAAVLDAHGRMKQMRILRGPAMGFEEALLGALQKWVFRPATVNGQPVAVQVLIGVPLVSYH